MISVTPWSGDTASETGELRALLAAYHLQTEAEKGDPVTVDELPERYRAEVLDPATAFAGQRVLIARNGSAAAGCLVIATASGETAEIKRLWTDPAHRGRGVASALLDAAFAQAATAGARTVRLSVWDWRADAIALYERYGFGVAESWEDRAHLICMTRSV